MTPDINALRKNFASLSDADLRKLTGEALNLTSEGLQALKEEARKRNLPILRTIDNVFNDEKEIDKMIEEKCVKLRDQPCPICKGDEYLINAIWLRTVTILSSKRVFHFACGKCLLEQKQKAETTTFLFGWWSPYTFMSTYQALKDNNNEMMEVQTGKPTKSLINHAKLSLEVEYRTVMLQVDVKVPVQKKSTH